MVLCLRLMPLATATMLLVGCATDPIPRVANAVEASQGWRVLLDEGGPRGLRTMGETALRPQWRMRDGALTLDGAGGGDITDGQVYDDFELEVEWAVQAGGNSGIFLRVDPDEAQAAWKSGVEYQLLDNNGHPNGADAETSAGAPFALYPARTRRLAPVGRFNTSRVVARGGRVTHLLNGEVAAEYDTAGDDFRAQVAASKFGKFADFGSRPSGLIVFQDHKDPIAFRLIRVRPLPK